MHRGDSCCGRSSQAADVWSCGVLLYIMIASAYPFGRPEDEPLAPAQKMQVMLQVWLIGCMQFRRGAVRSHVYKVLNIKHTTGW